VCNGDLGMKLFIQILVINIISFLKELIYDFKKKAVDDKVEKSLKEDKDASKKASDDYNDFKSAYNEYKSKHRTDKL
jgi:hypothetical protein